MLTDEEMEKMIKQDDDLLLLFEISISIILLILGVFIIMMVLKCYGL